MNGTFPRTVFVFLCGVAFSGCAPTRFERAVSFYANQYRVSDARSRQCKEQWNLRFNELMISDLDEAIEHSDEKELRRKAADVIRAANSLDESATFAEIDRLPAKGRTKLAQLAGTEANAKALRAQYRHRSNQALEKLLADIESLPEDRLRDRLRRIRRGIEAAPDDRGRFWRQLMLAWGAAPAWVGLNTVESKLKEKHSEKRGKTFDRAVVWNPPESTSTDPLQRFMPTIVLEWPEDRDYPPDYDRFGAAYLSATDGTINVGINTSRPMVYTYTSEAKINGKRFPQLVYNWWFPKHPEMEENDPAAGHIDGDCLRITLDGHGLPAIFEVMQSCGCGHLVFVSKRVEESARKAFGAPNDPKHHLSVEKNVSGKRSLILVDTVDVSETRSRPVVYILAGYHEVSRIDCAGKEAFDPAPIEQHAYELSDYDVLERLPLGDGVASMFGPDGLVHNAGRKEGYLLAPTGILSAGQPRQRGTQKIRWDDYSFDDPTLLSRALRLPEDF